MAAALAEEATGDNPLFAQLIEGIFTSPATIFRDDDLTTITAPEILEYEQAAYADGATPWQVFRKITIPLSWRDILAGALLIWARGVSEFGAVVILAYHPKIVPVLVYERFKGFGLSAAQPVAALLIIISLIAVGLLNVALLPRGNGK